MKTSKLQNMFFLLLGIVCVVSLGATSEFFHRAGTISNASSIICAVVSKGEGDINDTTTELADIEYASIERVVIDSNGIDTQYSVYIYDNAPEYNNVTIFSKTDCNSVNEPYSYAVSQADTAGNDFLGIPVLGPVSVYVTDVNEVNDPNVAHLDDLEILIYYRRSQ